MLTMEIVGAKDSLLYNALVETTTQQEVESGNQLINDGLITMATGMGTVFSFLVILWLTVSLMGRIVKKLNEIFPEPIAQTKTIVQKASDDIHIAIAVAMAKLR